MMATNDSVPSPAQLKERVASNALETVSRIDELTRKAENIGQRLPVLSIYRVLIIFMLINSLSGVFVGSAAAQNDTLSICDENSEIGGAVSTIMQTLYSLAIIAPLGYVIYSAARYGSTTNPGQRQQYGENIKTAGTVFVILLLAGPLLDFVTGIAGNSTANNCTDSVLPF